MDTFETSSQKHKRYIHHKTFLPQKRTRHKTAERVAKQTGELVISISERRGIITLFKGDFRYVINDTSSVLMRANQTLQALEKYKTVFI